MNNEGHVFLSHSHKDIINVRLIRNELEAMGFNPICFYLRSFDDVDDSNSNQKKYLENLLLKEIEARDYFIYLESEASKKAYWVQWELAMVNFLPGKKIFKINIEEPWVIQLSQLLKIIPEMKVSLLYTDIDSGYGDDVADFFSASGTLVAKRLLTSESAASTLSKVDQDIIEGIVLMPIFSYKSVNNGINSIIRDCISHALENPRAKIIILQELGCLGDTLPWSIQNSIAFSGKKISEDDLKRISIQYHNIVFSKTDD